MSERPIRIGLVTLGVEDLARASAFYEAMGLRRSRASQDTIHFYDMDGLVLALFPNDLLAEDAAVPAEGHGFRRQTLAWNVPDEASVDAGFARAIAAGAASLKRPTRQCGAGMSDTSPIPKAICGKSPTTRSSRLPPMVR